MIEKKVEIKVNKIAISLVVSMLVLVLLMSLEINFGIVSASNYQTNTFSNPKSQILFSLKFQTLFHNISRQESGPVHIIIKKREFIFCFSRE